MDSRNLRHRCEGLVVVDAMGLRLSLGHQSGLVLVDQTVGVVLHLVHPFTLDQFAMIGRVNQVPCVVDV